MGCVVDGCPKPHEARGYCAMHYRRWQLKGDPGGLPPTLQERFWAKVDKDGPSGCWLWIAQINPDGYGRFQIGSKKDGTARSALAHRVSYELAEGQIPDGLQLDHLCRVRHCVNPRHLEPVTQRVNIDRAVWPRSQRTSCPQGHDYTPENTYVHRGKRSCIRCMRDRTRRARERARASA